MKGWLDHLRREVARIGLAGIAGIGLVVFAMAFYFLGVRPADRALEALRAEAGALERQLRTGGSLVAVEATPAEELATFYAFFPSATTTPDWLRRINDAATSNGIVLESGEYRMQRADGTRLRRYEITLPIKGSYAQIRAFVAGVLGAVPAAVLEEVTLRRDRVESARLEARVRFTLYVGDAG